MIFYAPLEVILASGQVYTSGLRVWGTVFSQR